jgi:hypothetical protein
MKRMGTKSESWKNQMSIILKEDSNCMDSLK